MAKKKQKTIGDASVQISQPEGLFASEGAAFDPKLASLFSSSISAVTAPVKSAERESKKRKRSQPQKPVTEEPLVETSDVEADSQSLSADDTIPEAVGDLDVIAADSSKNSRKRQRDGDDELEALYLDKLVREEEKETAKRLRESKPAKSSGLEAQNGADAESGQESDEEDEDVDVDDDEGKASGDGSDDELREDDDEIVSVLDEEMSPPPRHETEMSPPPQHETATTNGLESNELEKSSRTVFLGNVAIAAATSKSAQKTLRAHLSSIFATMPESKPPHKIESMRFRSTAFDNKLPKKASFVKKDIKEATSKSTNAYVVYSTKAAAREAATKLNGTVVLDRHLRVDQVAHPQKVDHKRCVFVGNLDFVDDDAAIRAGNDKLDEKTQSKKKAPADVEEGLWRQFGKAGTVESVRVVRDAKTRVGKGFAYVQFTDENGVEAALLFNDQKFPPLLPRKLRVVRAKAIKRNAKTKASLAEQNESSSGYKPKLTAQQISMRGRASKLLGRAGAAQMAKTTGRFAATGANGTSVGNSRIPGAAIKPPEAFVFEGHRATASQGNRGLKLGGKSSGGKRGGKGGKPNGRSAKRAAAYAAAGGKKRK